MRSLKYRGGCMSTEKVGIEPKEVNELKELLKGCVGQKVIVRGSRGSEGKKSKAFEKTGTLIDASSNVFTLKRDDIPLSVSYMYKDVIAKNVQLQVGDNICFNPDINTTID